MTGPRQFLIYQSEDGSTRIDVMLEAETLWLNQKQLTELFGKAKGTISEYIKHIFEDSELTPEATVRNNRTVRSQEGCDVTREITGRNRSAMNFLIADTFIGKPGGIIVKIIKV